MVLDTLQAKKKPVEACVKTLKRLFINLLQNAAMVILFCCKWIFIVNSVGVPIPRTFSDLYTKLHCPAATQKLCSNIFSSLAIDSSFSTLVHNYISSLSFKEVSIPTTKRISPLHVRVNNKLCFSMDFFSFTSGRNGSS